MAIVPEQLKQVVRRLLRAPLFSTLCLLTIAIGIGANTVVFSVVDGVLLKPLAYPHPERLLGIWYTAPGVNIPKLNMAPFLYFTEREQSTTLEEIGMYQGDGVSVTGGAQPEHLDAMDVTDGILPMLGVNPALGRVFSRQDDQPSSPKTIMISHGYWQRHFNGNRSVVGQSLNVNGTAREIVGVLPKGFHFLDWPDSDILLPMQLDRSKTKLGNFSYEGMARLKPGVTVQQANAEVARLIPIAIHSFPPPEGFSAAIFETARFTPDLHSLKEDVVGDVGKVLWVLLGSIGIVLLVACANVANLLLVRVEGRRQELAIRTALGGSRRDITLVILMESLALGLVGSALGLALAFGALRVLIAAAPTGLPRLHEIGMNAPVLLFTLGLGLFVSAAIALIPVIKYSSVRVSTGLREGGRALSQSRERHRARKTLVVVQVALALVLLICSGLMIRTFLALARVSPGFAEPKTLQSFSIFIPDSQIPDTQKERVVRTEQAIANKLASIAGVSSVSITSAVPLTGQYSMDPVYAADHTYKAGELAPVRHFKFISPGTFATFGTPLVAGRDLTWAETFEKRPVAIISENFAREYWGSRENALGKRIRVGSNDDWREIIGVAANVYDDGVSQASPTTVYWPLFQNNFEVDKEVVRRYVNFVMRTPRAGTSAFMSEVQRAVWSVDPDLPLSDIQTLGELYRKSMARTSFTLVMLCVAGSMALLLGIIGIYGVISYAVSQRTREIGIRMALGAQRQALTGLFVRQGLMLAAIGVACGIGTAILSVRLMRSLLFQVSPVDPWTYALATGCIVAIAWIASYMPSRRASAVNPVTALRAE
ncbi:ABC transporter permease [Acidobacteria bacterium AB60]|nr:ABC transporter permease [Acidobacteria bacterium AB60]